MVSLRVQFPPPPPKADFKRFLDHLQELAHKLVHQTEGGSMLYLLKRGHRFYFRIKVPKDLQSFFRCREIKKSLKTRLLAHAKIDSVSLFSETQRIFTLIRSRMLTDIQIKTLVRQFIDNTLKDTEDSRSNGYYLPTDEHALDSTIDAHDDKIAEYKEALAFNKTESIKHLVDDLIQDNSLTIEEQSEDYKKLSREVLKAVIEVLQSLESDWSDAMAAGASDYIQKPLALDQFSKMLASILNRWMPN